jgi:gas vesicle protein
MLAQSVSKRSAKDLTPFGKEISSLMMEVMLPMTEYTGQLRGLGSGIAAKGKITKENIENLQALAYELQSLNKKLQNKMIKITTKYPSKLSSNIINKIENIDKQVQDYIAFIQNKLIKNPKNVNPDAYFDKGTQLIASIVKVYDVTNQALLEDSKGWL